MTERLCKGFPRPTGCGKPLRVYADGYRAHWCEEHDRMRIDHIGKSLDSMIAKLEERDRGVTE